jgi:hypothetical protein
MLTKEMSQDLVTFTKKLETYQKENSKDQNSDMSQQISKIINSSNLLLCFFAYEE